MRLMTLPDLRRDTCILCSCLPAPQFQDMENSRVARAAATIFLQGTAYSAPVHRCPKTGADLVLGREPKFRVLDTLLPSFRRYPSLRDFSGLGTERPACPKQTRATRGTRRSIRSITVMGRSMCWNTV